MRKFKLYFIFALLSCFITNVKGNYKVNECINDDLQAFQTSNTSDESKRTIAEQKDTLCNVTFNIHFVDYSKYFDTVRVFVSGATADGLNGIGNHNPWPVPLEDLSFELFDDNEDLIYTITVPNVSPGDYKYKYGLISTEPGTLPNWNYPLPPQFDTLVFTVVDQDVTIYDMCPYNGIADNKTLSDFDIYPNPTRGKVTIRINNNCELTITNIVGQVILKRTAGKNEKVDLSNQMQGVYLITAKTNKAIKTKRLIIE